MSYWRLYYHVVWATRQREPIITSEIEHALYPIVAAKADENDAPVFAIGGMPDHIHLVAAIPPTVALSTFVKTIKGTSSYAISREFDIPFSWQRGYGVFSLSEANLKTVVDYVDRQKDHHREHTVIAAMERIEQADHGPRLRGLGAKSDA